MMGEKADRHAMMKRISLLWVHVSVSGVCNNIPLV